MKLNKKHFIFSIFLFIMGLAFFIINGGRPITNINIKNKETAKKKLVIEDFKVPKLELELVSNDIYSMKIPKGWIIEITGEYESFGFHLYDPNNLGLHIYYYGNFSPFLKSNEAKELWNYYISTSGFADSKYLADAYVIETPNIESVYALFDKFTKYAKQYGVNHNFPYLGKYNLIERLNYETPMNSVAEDEAILRLELKQQNIDCQALVAGTIVNVIKYNANGIDTGYYTVYALSGFIAPFDDFKYYEEVLRESLSSFKFNEKYVEQGVQLIEWKTEEALKLGKTLSEISDSYNQAWWDRQKTHDVLSEKRSDSNLGYDRVYDTETGATYKMELGLYDEYKNSLEEYSNSKLELVPDNEYDLYLQPISGYILK